MIIKEETEKVEHEKSEKEFRSKLDLQFPDNFNLTYSSYNMFNVTENYFLFLCRDIGWLFFSGDEIVFYVKGYKNYQKIKTYLENSTNKFSVIIK